MKAGAHEFDMMPQYVERAGIGDRTSETVCLLFQLFKLHRDLASDIFAAGGFQLLLEEPQLTVQARNLAPHRPIVENGQIPHHWVEHADDRNEQDDELTDQLSDPERQIIVQERRAPFVETQRFVAEWEAKGFSH